MRSRRLRRGSILITAIVVLAATVAIVIAASATRRVAFEAGLNRMESRRARLAAEAGIHFALASLVDQEPGQVTLNDDWVTVGENGTNSYSMTDGSFRLQIIDAAAMINLNTASEEVLTQLPLTTEQIESLLDWRSAGNTARPEGGKDEYYNSLTEPYNTKLRRLDSFDELLLIKGFDPLTLYDPQAFASGSFNVQGSENSTLYGISTTDSFSPNTNAQGQPKTDINAATLQQMVQAGLPQPLAQAIFIRRTSQGNFTSMGDVLRVAGVTLQNAGTLIDNFGISVETRIEGRLNINTATEQLLTNLPGFTPDVAASIISRQATGFTSVSELTTVPGFTLEMLQSTADLFATGSDTFIIRATGTAGGTTVALEAIVTLNEGPKILKIYDTPYNDMTFLWSWEAEPTNEVDLGAAR